MNLLYHACWKVGDPAKWPTLDHIIETIKAWLHPEKYAQRLQGFDTGLMLSEQGCYLHSVRQGHYFAVRVEHYKRRILWRIDAIVVEHQGAAPQCSVQLWTTPETHTVSRPRVVVDLFEKYGGFREYQFSLSPSRLELSDVVDVAQKMKDENRELPIIYVSHERASGQSLLNTVELASLTLGIGYLYEETSLKVGKALEEFIGWKNVCTDGQVGIYLPSAARDVPLRFNQELLNNKVTPEEFIFRKLARRSSDYDPKLIFSRDEGYDVVPDGCNDIL